MKLATRRAAVVLLFALLLLPRVSAQVTYDRLLKAADDARNWITYNGNYASNRYSQLRQITRVTLDGVRRHPADVAQIADILIDEMRVSHV